MKSLLKFLLLLFLLEPAQACAVVNLMYHTMQSHHKSNTPEKSVVFKDNSVITHSREYTYSTDVRAKFDLSDDTNQHEINLGLSIRRPNYNSYQTLGSYAFWDVSHIKEQTYAQQSTIGFEWFSPKSYLSTNYYLPLPNFTTSLNLYNSSSLQNLHWIQTQQEGLLRDIKTLGGFDINFSRTLQFNRQYRFGLDLCYSAYHSGTFSEVGPDLGLFFTHMNRYYDTSYQVHGQYNNHQNKSISLRSEVQWKSRLTRPSFDYSLFHEIRRDIDIRTIPLTLKPYLKVKSIRGNSYPYGGSKVELGILAQYLHDNFNVIEVIDDSYSDILVLGPTWLWFSDQPTIDQQTKLISQDPAKIKIFYAGEPENSKSSATIFNAVDLMISSDITNNPQHFRYHWGHNIIPSEYMTLKHTPDTLPVPRKQGCHPEEKTYFACFLTTNGNTKHYSGVKDRIDLFDKLSEYKFVASAGKVRRNLTKIPKGKGIAENFYSKCKFAIVYENSKDVGYITEKPFRAWSGGAIPIYDAHTSVKKDLNMKSIIFAGNFNNQSDLIEEIKRLDQDDHAYCEKWHENILDEPYQEWKSVQGQLYRRIDQLFHEKLTITLPARM